MIVARIHNKYNELTETEKKIASYVLANGERAVRSTAKELAKECGTVPSAVMRFVKSIGCDGFSEFKIGLAGELGDTQEADNRLPAFHASDSAEDVFRKVFASGMNTLRDTLAMIDFEKVEEITRKLKEAERIVIFGVGTSSVIAIDAQYRFAQLGLSVTACTDVLFMNVTALNMHKGDVAIGISHSGRTKAVVDAMRRAKEAGAYTFAITSFSDGILAKESECFISAFADEVNYPVEAVSARVAHVCIVDALTMTLATLDYEQFEKHIHGRNRVLSEIRY